MEFRIVLLRDSNGVSSYHVIAISLNSSLNLYTASIISRDHQLAFLHNGTSVDEAFENCFDEFIDDGYAIIEYGNYEPSIEFITRYNKFNLT